MPNSFKQACDALRDLLAGASLGQTATIKSLAFEAKELESSNAIRVTVFPILTATSAHAGRWESDKTFQIGVQILRPLAPVDELGESEECWALIEYVENVEDFICKQRHIAQMRIAGVATTPGRNPFDVPSIQQHNMFQAVIVIDLVVAGISHL